MKPYDYVIKLKAHITALEAEINRLRSELLAAERKDWTPSKGGRLG